MINGDVLEFVPNIFKVNGKPSIKLSIITIDNVIEKSREVQVKTNSMNDGGIG